MTHRKMMKCNNLNLIETLSDSQVFIKIMKFRKILVLIKKQQLLQRLKET